MNKPPLSMRAYACTNPTSASAWLAKAADVKPLYPVLNYGRATPEYAYSYQYAARRLILKDPRNHD
jgi:hypothetical protein